MILATHYVVAAPGSDVSITANGMAVVVGITSAEQPISMVATTTLGVQPVKRI
jgi:hypothetical protein